MQGRDKARNWKDVRKGERKDLLVLLSKMRAQLLHGKEGKEAQVGEEIERIGNRAELDTKLIESEMVKIKLLE